MCVCLWLCVCLFVCRFYFCRRNESERASERAKATNTNKMATKARMNTVCTLSSIVECSSKCPNISMMECSHLAVVADSKSPKIGAITNVYTFRHSHRSVVTHLPIKYSHGGRNSFGRTHTEGEGNMQQSIYYNNNGNERLEREKNNKDAFERANIAINSKFI